MSTKDVNLQFIVARLLHEVSKRKECESFETTALVNKTHKSNEKLCLYCKKFGHFVKNCLKKKSDEKEKANQACEDHENIGNNLKNKQEMKASRLMKWNNCIN
jgi:hypothetical protein